MADKRGLRAALNDYRPSVVTGGLPITPLLVLAGLNAVDELDRSAFGVLLPEIRDYFGVSLTSILTVQSLAALLPFLLSVPIGYFGDRLDRTKLSGTGATFFGLFSIVTALSGNLFFLGMARFGAGLGRTIDTANSSLLADYYPPDRRSGVYSLYLMGDQLGLVVAPIAAGWLASIFYWQIPFIVFSIPSLLLAMYTFFVLREPTRGGQERRAAGLEDEDVEGLAEDPPGWTESWRIAKGVRTLRRIWAALPFLSATFFGGLALLTIYLDEEFHLGEGARGTFASISQLVGLFGILAGGAFGNRLLALRPARVIQVVSAVTIIPAACWGVLAVSPWIGLSFAASLVASFITPALLPQLSAMISLTIPPRARSFAIAAGALFAAPGLLVPPLVGAIADAHGVRFGLLLVVPVLLTGAAIVGSAGPSVEADMRAAQAAALAAQTTIESRREGKAKLLVCRDLDVHYGTVQILFGVDFEVDEGEIVALLGTNGAGKSTLLNAIGGVVTPSNGAIFFDGDDITYLPAPEHVSTGIVTVPGGKGVFPTLSVAENLRLASWPYRDDQAYVREATEKVLTMFPRLRERLDEAAGSLSGGEQQMLALSQAFIAKPRLLMIDELSLGLAPAIVEQLLGIVREIHANGTTIILVEQSVNVALTVAQRAVFMEKGEVRFSGPTSELLGRGDILRSVFLAGSGVGSRLKKPRVALPWDEEKETVLRIEGVTKRFGGVHAINGVDLTLREGEVLGLIGPNGAGKTTLFDLISGFVLPDQGTVTLLGDDITQLGPDARARLGLQRSFQDARLFPALTVEENLLVALNRSVTAKSMAAAGLRLPSSTKAEARLQKRVERLLMLLNLGAFRDKFVRELSTGSRRLVDLACILGTDPQVLLLDEPSSGVAQRETEELGPLIQRIKSETACSILIIEHDMQLISSISDELIAMDLGAVVTRGRPDEVLSHPRVVESYLGTSEEAIKRSGALT